MSKDKKELAVTEKQTALALPPNLSGTWGAEGADSTDIKVPVLRLLQQMSEIVGEGKAQAGDFLRSTTQTVICPKGESFEFIPLMTYKTWHLSKKIGQKFEYQKQVPMTAENMNDPWEWLEDGEEWKRTRALNFYVLLPSDIEREVKALAAAKNGEMPDPADALLPCVMTFKGTSYDAGKDLITHFKKAEHFNVPPAVTTFKATSEFVKGDQGHYYVVRVANSRKTTVDELTVCKGWYDTLKVATVVVDEAEETPAEATPQVNADVAKF